MCRASARVTIPGMFRRSSSQLRSIILPGLVVALVAALVPVIVFTSVRPDSTAATVAAAALVVVQAATLLWMPTRPEQAMSVAVAAGVGLEQLCPSLGFLGVANVMLSALSWQRPPRVSLWALGAMIVLSPLELATGGGATGVLFAVGGAAFAWTWGELWRTRRARRADAARRTRADERARIARELHDVVAHHVSLIVVQAVAADDAFDERPEVARKALRTIESSGRDALAELRRLLQTMRPDQADDDAHAPQPGLGQLDTLAATVEAAGLAVVVRREGAAVALPAGIDLSAYRIVQEALTNTLRHAHATRAEVTVRYAEDALAIEVRDDGGGGSASAADLGGGHGIVGMRERAALVGGTLEIGAAPRGGFRVRAELPLGTRA
jgi:signal transduction histidine kinase